MPRRKAVGGSLPSPKPRQRRRGRGRSTSKRQPQPPRRRTCAADLVRFDRRILAGGCQCLAGIDEAGRGALAGPVVAAAVILRPRAPFPELRDSKTLNAKQRERLYEELLQLAECWAVGVVEADAIDAVNILQATHQAMCCAVRGLELAPDHLLVDGLPVPSLPIPHTPVVGGDQLSLSVAGASIIAKVERDRIMCALDALYPQYGFAQNKGYGTKSHIAALKAHGISPVHRRSFGPVKLLAQKELEL